MHPAVFVMAAGIALSLAGWIWFRHPGQAFWVAGPVWKASRFLNPTGSKLWIAGTLVSLAGFIWLVSGLVAAFAARSGSGA